MLCSTPVYEELIELNAVLLLADITTLFAQVAGAKRQYKYVNQDEAHCFILPTCTIDTQAYVTQVTKSHHQLETHTKSIRLLPVQVCEYVNDVDVVELLFVFVSNAIVAERVAFL